MSSTNLGETAPSSGEFYLRALKKHVALGLLVTVAVLAASVFFTIGQTRIYEASARLVIDPDPPRPLGKEVQAVVDVGNGSYWGNREYFETQAKILAGLAVSRETVRALGLHSDLAFIANSPPGQAPPSDVRALPVDEAARILHKRLRVETIRDSRLVNVFLADANPERAKRVLSTLLDIYIERNIEHVVKSTMAASEWLGGQTGKLKEELEKSELALHDYKKHKQILSVSLDDQSNMLRGEMQQLSEALTRVSAKREELKARVLELNKVDPEEPTNLPTTELLGSSLLSSLRQSYVQAKNEYSSLLGLGKGPSHPEAAAAGARVANTRDALVAEVRNIQGALRSELAAAEHEHGGLESLFGRAKQRAFELNMLEIEYRRLERAKSNTEKLYGLVVERSKESELTGMLRFNNIRVEEPATVGKRPVVPRVPLNIAIGLIIGLVLGAGTALGRGYFDQTVRTPHELESDLGLPLLGVLPSLNERSRTGGYYSRRAQRRGGNPSGVGDDTSMELIVHSLPASHAAECVRVIRTSLTFAAPDKPYRRILVTSANPSEGKTTVAISIATAFAQAGQKVLLIDADLRRARMHRVFGCSNSEGVSTALQNHGALENALIPTQVPNLTLLPGGPHVPSPAELIQSASFVRLLELLDARYDRIIIDSPPILAVADGTILATQVAVTVLVVRAAKTRMDHVRQTIRKLREVGTPVAGVVLNALEPPRWGTRHYYYYYYGKNEGGTYGYGNRREA